MTVTTKATVRFHQITPALVRILHTLVEWPVSDDGPGALVITSGSDGTHQDGSKHYTGEALDLRSQNFGRGQKAAFRAALEDALGPSFRVLLEAFGQPQEHFHVQVRKGHTFP